MKRLILLLTAVCILMNPFAVTEAASIPMPITMYINEQFVYTDAQPFLYNEEVYVPVRFISEALGMDDIVWNGENQSVTVTYGTKIIQLFMNQSKVLVNGFEFALDHKPTLINERAMVPLQFVAENYDFDIAWDSQTSSLLITKEGMDVDLGYSENAYTPNDVIWLARIVHVEGQGMSLDGKLAIANVVLNRKNSGVFPSSIYGVIFQSGQFPPAYKDGFSSLVPKQECILAAKLALNGENNISRCLYFNHVPFSSKSEDLYKIIDGEYFYY